MKKLIPLFLLLTSCGGSNTPAPPIPPIPPFIPPSITNLYPTAKVYIDNGRSFYYVENGQTVYPALIVQGWNKAKGEILTLRPNAILNDPLSSLVFVFEPVDKVGSTGSTGYEVCRQGNLDCQTLRDSVKNAGGYCDTTGCYLVSNTCEPFTCSIPTIFLVPTTILASVEFEGRHALWFSTFPTESCSSNPAVQVWKVVGEGGPCDPFSSQ